MALWIRGWYQAGDASQACTSRVCCRWKIPSLQQCQFVPNSPLGKKKITAGSAVTAALLSLTSSCLLLLRCLWASAWLQVSEWGMPWEQGMWSKPRHPASLLCCVQVSALLQSRIKGNYQQMVQGQGCPIGTQSHLFGPFGEGKILTHLFCYEPSAKVHNSFLII